MLQDFGDANNSQFLKTDLNHAEQHKVDLLVKTKIYKSEAGCSTDCSNLEPTALGSHALHNRKVNNPL